MKSRVLGITNTAPTNDLRIKLKKQKPTTCKLSELFFDFVLIKL